MVQWDKVQWRVVDRLSDRIDVAALAVCENLESLERDVARFSPQMVAIYNEKKASQFAAKHPSIAVKSGLQGLIEIASSEEVDFVMQAMSGSEGLAPTLAAIEKGKTIGLANKEVLVMAGEMIMRLASQHKATILPVDSEHSAIFQCIQGEDAKKIERIILTASGGPFFTRDPATFSSITVEEALCHPSWKMGKKITIDSSTMANKGLEVIEASYLFGLPPEKIDVVIHPQSMVHSFVEWRDGSITAQIANPDMFLPIQYALTYPDREKSPTKRVDFQKIHRWDFLPSPHSFPCLHLAYEVLRKKRSYPCFFSVCNEILVKRFLSKEISWKAIGEKLAQLISFHRGEDLLSLEDVRENRIFCSRDSYQYLNKIV